MLLTSLMREASHVKPSDKLLAKLSLYAIGSVRLLPIRQPPHTAWGLPSPSEYCALRVDENRDLNSPLAVPGGHRPFTHAVVESPT